MKEVEQIERMFEFLKTENELRSLRKMFAMCLPGWQKTILNNLKALNKKEMIDVLV